MFVSKASSAKTHGQKREWETESAYKYVRLDQEERERCNDDGFERAFEEVFAALSFQINQRNMNRRDRRSSGPATLP